ncbi:hypothetical protein IW262DRAFT_1342688 [Armillaria fumosa]|nr:hypothetical protein IW262DRAFT_1342688 [Armillaria fumosa]
MATRYKQVRDQTFFYQCKISQIEVHSICTSKIALTTIIVPSPTVSFSQSPPILSTKIPGYTRNQISCACMFQALSEVAHLESGGCNPRINRHHVTTSVHGMNVYTTICISDCIGGPAISRHVHLAATEMAFNEEAYECHLCYDTFRTALP